MVARLGPDATGLGWIYQYYFEVDDAKAPNGRGYDLGELRALQDWFVRYQLNAVPGVAEVGSIGGFVRQYQIEVSSQKMRALDVTLEDVVTAVGQSNLNVGGKTIEESGMEFVVRGIGSAPARLTGRAGVPWWRLASRCWQAPAGGAAR